MGHAQKINDDRVDLGLVVKSAYVAHRTDRLLLKTKPDRIKKPALERGAGFFIAEVLSARTIAFTLRPDYQIDGLRDSAPHQHLKSTLEQTNEQNGQPA